MNDLFITPSELAQRWRISAQTLANWRSAGRGPPYIRLGRGILYRLSEIEALEHEETRNEPTAFA